ncbi:uncharacterized protein TRIVIDRAFT_67567 [Trichoderma virens Gv29-8]|uniref:HNH nuclease domain-containing protein n=1 Tax=Hypocrea virens (strain Gv29-8 / FGSC 10586) TaxID=413071 RepID=G9MPX3_HYPVG|nr:uncharacterized protein TRIVIDRAFT_67567 [Trichoderma virens Gv29-8]EHK23923.1 hypothetical protein TRIVIDRAFT_67567 [Trichoderma virens Gv29-8]UKZ50227.1 hypothetical protein TrVGV298_004485 [Trichoderma virens]
MDLHTPALSEFPASKMGTEEDKKDLKCLGDRPKRAPTTSLLPMEEMDVRLRIIDVIREKLERWNGSETQLTYLQFSALLLMPLDFLMNLKESFPGSLQHDISVEYIQASLFFFMKGRTPGSVAASDADQDGSQGTSEATYRDAVERTKCRARDTHTCILTQSTLPDVSVCHFLPFSIGATEENMAYFKKCGFLMYAFSFGTDQYETARTMAEQRGWLDKAWNMVCLDRQLRAWWAEGYFALKYLETIQKSEIESIVQIQFYWMPRNGLDYGRECSIHQDVVERMLCTAPGRDGFTGGTTKSGQSLETGQIFEIIVSPEEAPKMRLVIDTQWAMIRLAALSGAVGHMDRLDKEYIDPWDEDDEHFKECI